jgi:membrane protein YdbS with pleckstrin-like domain
MLTTLMIVLMGILNLLVGVAGLWYAHETLKWRKEQAQFKAQALRVTHAPAQG